MEMGSMPEEGLSPGSSGACGGGVSSAKILLGNRYGKLRRNVGIPGFGYKLKQGRDRNNFLFYIKALAMLLTVVGGPPLAAGRIGTIS
jgi:hypothetical protein